MLTASELYLAPNKISWMVSMNFLKPYENTNIKLGVEEVEGEEGGEGWMRGEAKSNDSSLTKSNSRVIPTLSLVPKLTGQWNLLTTELFFNISFAIYSSNFQLCCDIQHPTSIWTLAISPRALLASLQSCLRVSTLSSGLWENWPCVWMVT